ncbi:MAG: bla [Bacteroidetes bacterium]|jgi:glyoxylase-like metal-dependent hydrolase (beta-lactamase superfamily II)|nr:bla [Bacteroidota bacterium]
MKKHILFLLVILPFLVSGQKKAVLEITKLRADFYIFTTYNLYKGVAVPANGLYVVTTDGVLLIDTPWDTTQLQPLLDSIELRHNKKVILCIATHSHEDRTGGLEYYKKQGIKTYTSLQTDKICKEQHQKRPEFIFTKDTVFTLGQYSFTTLYAGPGHTPDNLVIWFGKEKVLYGGCFIKSTESTDLGNLNDANVKEWSNTLKKIRKKVGQPDHVIPGHMDWSNNRSMEHTLKLLKEHKKKK